MPISLIHVRYLRLPLTTHLRTLRVRLFVLLGFLLISLAACGQRIDGGTTAATTDAPLVIDLPALYLDYDATGIAYIGSVKAADLGPALGVDLSRVNVMPELVSRLQAAKIQHIQLTNTPAGLQLFVNGRRVPSLVWDEATLQLTAETVAALGTSAELLRPLIPLATDLGGGLVLRFPLAPEATAVPFVVASDGALLTAARQTQADYLAIIGTPPPLTITVDYALDGSWTVDGLTGEQWADAMPLPWTRLNLPAELVQGASGAGIVTLQLRANQLGLFIKINGRLLPHISWAEGELENLMTLAADTGLLNEALGTNPHTDTLLTTIQGLLPIVTATPVTLQVNFPQP